MKNCYKRLIAAIIAVSMFFTYVPVNDAFAAEKLSTVISILENTRIMTIGEDHFISSDGAKVYSGTTLIGETDKSGKLLLDPNMTSRLLKRTLTVKKEGYDDEKFVLKAKLINRVELHHSELIGPVFHAVNMSLVPEDDPEYDPSDASDEDQGFEMDVANRDPVYFDVDCDLNNTSLKSVVLYQDGIQMKFDSLKFDCELGKKFSLKEDMYILITDTHGNTVKKKLYISTFSENEFIQKLQEGGFSFGQDMTFTIPESIPLVGGMPIGFAFSQPFPINIEFEDGKWLGSIGVNLASGDNTDGVKGFTETFKSAYRQQGFKDQKERFNDLRNDYKEAMKDTKKPEGSFNLSVMGFVEGYVKDNEPVVSDGGVILLLEGEIGWVLPFTLVIPMFFEFNLEGALQGTAYIWVSDEKNDLLPLGQIEFTPMASAGIGIGVARVLAVSGGIKGGADVIWKFGRKENNYFKIAGKLKAYAKAVIVFFTAGKEWDIDEAVWYEYPEPNVDGAASVDGAPADRELIGAADRDSFTVVDLSYLDGEESVDGSAEASCDAGFGYLDKKDAEVLVANLYRESQVALGELSDGREIAVYINSPDSNPDNLELYVKVHNKDGWSQPQLICDDGTTDSMPVLYVQNDKVYVAWQNATEKFFESGSGAELKLDDIAHGFDISVAELTVSANGIETVSGNAVSASVTSFETEGLDTMPVITGDGESVFVVWNCNKDYDWFSEQPGRNAIYVSQLKDGGWSDAQIKIDAIDNVLSLDAYAADGKLNIAYAAKDNRSAAISAPSYVYENGKRVSTSAENESAPVYLNNELFWYSQGNIMRRGIKLGNGEIDSDDYDLMYVDDTVVALYKSYDGIESTIQMAAFDDVDNKWISGTLFADNESNIQDYACILDKNGDIKLLVNDVETVMDIEDIHLGDADPSNDNPYGTAHLVMIYGGSYTDAEITDTDCDAESFEVGSEIVVEVSVLNSGTEILKNAKAILRDSAGNELTTWNASDDILPGEEIEFEMKFTVTNPELQRNLTVDIVADELTKDKETQQTLSISNENISIEYIDYVMMDRDNADIQVIVSNDGESVRENIELEIRKTTWDGEVAGSVIVPKLEPGSIELATVSIPVADGDVYYAYIGDTKLEDEEIGDNYNFIVINSDGGPTYNAENPFGETVSQNIVLNGNTYPVSFVPENGQKEGFIAAAKKNGVKLSKLTKEGYTFKGWYDDKQGKKLTRLTDKYLKSNPELVLRAVWAQNQYNVKYVITKPGKSAKLISKPGSISKVNYTETITLSEGPVCQGYTFMGWAAQKDGAVVYAPGSSVSKLGGKTKKDRNIKLYSVWEPVKKQ